MKRSLILLLPLAVCGCGGAQDVDLLPATVVGLKDVALSARGEAQAAQEGKDVAAAAAAAARAEMAVAKLDELLGASQEIADADKEAQREAKQAARKARYFADLAREQQQIADALGSWKARTYRAARGLAMSGAWKAMALSAEQAGKRDLASLPVPAQQAAKDAARLAHEFGGREPLPNGEPDWQGVAADLNGYVQNPPAQIPLVLAAAFLLSGQIDFALYEIEAVDVSVLKKPHDRELVALARALAYSSHGWRHSAVLACEEIPGSTEGDSAPLLAYVHLFLGYSHLQNSDYENADRELVRAMRVWPNNPASVFLTGEYLAATGEREKAAKSLESVTAGTHDEWLAQRVAERARQIRDGQDDGDTLFHDREFVIHVALHYLAVAARESEWAARVQRSIQAARGFGSAMLEHLPGAK